MPHCKYHVTNSVIYDVTGSAKILATTNTAET